MPLTGVEFHTLVIQPASYVMYCRRHAVSQACTNNKIRSGRPPQSLAMQWIEPYSLCTDSFCKEWTDRQTDVRRESNLRFMYSRSCVLLTELFFCFQPKKSEIMFFSTEFSITRFSRNFVSSGTHNILCPLVHTTFCVLWYTQHL